MTIDKYLILIIGTNTSPPLDLVAFNYLLTGNHVHRQFPCKSVTAAPSADPYFTNPRVRVKKRCQHPTMGTTGDSHEATPFVTAQEVGGVQQTLNNFMKAQEEHNKMLQNTMDQVMGYLSQVTGHSGSSPLEG